MMPNTHPLVTVLVPTYNRASFLKETIDSVLVQNFIDFELLVVDNYSTDNTYDVVHSYSDPRIRYVCNDSNLGIIGNYNRGLRESAGDYIYLLSDDDIMCDESNLKLKVDVLEKFSNVSMVFSSFKTINSNGEIVGGNWAETSQIWPKVAASPLINGHLAFQLLYNNWNFICMHTVLVRKSTLVKHNIQFSNQLKYLLDWALWLHLSLVSDLYYLSDILVSYRVHETNTTKAISLENYAIELFSIKAGLASLFYASSDIVPKDFESIRKSTELQVGVNNKDWIKNKLSRIKRLVLGKDNY
ncbi:MAG: glycosyltransferase [Sphingobacteriaceae bacterium]|nr:MAG: glycosyltransferase [Sphingobacteriaceae bacterium]